jgi:hypothetical protein
MEVGIKQYFKRKDTTFSMKERRLERGVEFHNDQTLKNPDMRKKKDLQKFKFGGKELVFHEKEFRGSFVNSLRNGKGILTFWEGHLFQGMFENGCKHGEGILLFGDQTDPASYGKYYKFIFDTDIIVDIEEEGRDEGDRLFTEIIPEYSPSFLKLDILEKNGQAY